MANVLTASIYSYQSNPDFTDQYGIQMGFPVENIVIRGLPNPIPFQGVDCNSTIEVISDTSPFPTYYASENVTTLISDANAASSASEVVVSNISNDMFDQTVTVGRYNQVEITFDQIDPDLITDVTVTKTNGGDAINSGGQAVFSTGVNTNGGIKCVTNSNVVYRPNAEIYAEFSCIFTNGIATSYQRIGPYDTNNGFYIGYEGVFFGVTIRKAGVNVTTPKSSFNVDTLIGAATSKFTRNGVPEALDTTKDNIYRIRYGWLGAAPVVFEVMSPDGEWVLFNIYRHPNTVAATSINNPDLPITLDVQKTSAGVTNLVVSTACWAIGTSSDLQKISSTLTENTLVKPVRSVLVAKQPSGSYTNIDATAGGNLKVSVEEIDGAVIVPVTGSVSLNAGTNYVGKVRLTDGTTDAEVVPLTGYNAQAVAIVDGSGNQVTSFGGGTQYADGTAVVTPTGTVALGFDGTNVQALSSTSAGLLNVADGGGSITVDGTVTANAGTGNFTVVQASAANLNATVTGSVSVSNFPATQPISGTVTANAGTGTFTVGGTVTADAGTGNFTVVQATAANLNATVTGTVIADTELPTAAALSDSTANPTTPLVGAALEAYNGTTWDRLKTDAALAGTSANDTTVGILATGIGPGFSIRLNPTNLGTAVNSASTINVDGATTMSIGIGTTTTGTFIFEGTADATNWFSVEVFDATADLWVSGQNLTPTLGKTYHIASGGLRQIRLRTVTTLGATMAHVVNLSLSQQLIAGIDTGAAPHNFGYSNLHKDGEYATQQTGTALWTPASGKKFVVADITITTGNTTSGIVTLWQGAVADTTYTAGTDPAVFRGEFAPSANSKPGVVKSFNVPYVSTTADHILRVTTSAAMTVYVQCNGYEI